MSNVIGETNGILDWLMSDGLYKLLNHGVSLAILAAVFYALFKTGSWIGAQFLVPIRDAAVSHLKTTDENIRANTRALNKIETHMSRQSETNDAMLLVIQELERKKSE